MFGFPMLSMNVRMCLVRKKSSVLKRVAALVVFAVSLLALQAGDKKKVVFLVGDDLNHGSGTHEFYAGGLLLKDSLANWHSKKSDMTLI